MYRNGKQDQVGESNCAQYIHINLSGATALRKSFFFLWFVTTYFFYVWENTNKLIFRACSYSWRIIFFYTLLSRHTENGECETAKCCCLSFFLLYIFLLFFSEFLVKHKKPCEHFWCGYIFFPFSFKNFPPLSTFSSLLFSSFD